MKKVFAALASAGLMTVGASAEDASDTVAYKQAIVPEGSEQTVEQFQYSPAVRAGDFVFFSGVVAGLDMNDEGEFIDESAENLQRAYRGAFGYLGKVLKEAGADWDDVVEMTTYHTELRTQGAPFLAVKSEFLKEPFHAWTAIDVDRLWPDSGITEIKIIAYSPQKNRPE